MSLEPLLTVPDVAAVLAVPRARVYGLVYAGILRPVRLGRSLRFTRESIDAFIAAGGHALGHDGEPSVAARAHGCAPTPFDAAAAVA